MKTSNMYQSSEQKFKRQTWLRCQVGAEMLQIVCVFVFYQFYIDLVYHLFLLHYGDF